MGEGSRLLAGRGLATENDIEHTEAHGRARHGRARPRQPRRSSAAQTNAARSDPAITFWKCSASMRFSTSRPSAGAGPRHGVRDDPLRFAGAGLPGVRRRAQLLREAPRSTASTCPTGNWCALRPAVRRACTISAHVCGGQFRLVQPAAFDVASPRVLRPRVRRTLGVAGHVARVRRGAQHRQARAAQHGRPPAQECGSSQGGHAGLPAGPPRNPGGVPRTSASR